MKLFQLDKLIVGLFLCLNYTTLQGQNASNNLAKATSTIDKQYAKLIKKHKVVGASMAIIDNGKIVYSNGFGFADKANNIKATPNTVYKIASITKSFTALAVMQLHEKGVFDINESIKKYIPELTIPSPFQDGNEIHIKDVLSHIYGLPSDILNGMMATEVPDMAWTINELNKQQTISPNHYTMAYSNVGYGLLGELIQRVSGVSYEEYVYKNIFKPLEMSASSAANSIPKNLSKGYANKKEFTPEKFRDFSSACISSSGLDLANFTLMMLQNGQFKSKSKNSQYPRLLH